MQLLDSHFTDNSLFTISKPTVAQTLFESAFLLDQPIIYKIIYKRLCGLFKLSCKYMFNILSIL